MTSEDDFRIRPGRIRSRRDPARKALHRPGARRRPEGRRRSPRTGQDRRAARFTLRPRPCRQRPGQPAADRPLAARHDQDPRRPAHAPPRDARPPISTISGARASRGTVRRRVLFGPETEKADPKAFAERCEDDRHHFRFIVSPDDAVGDGRPEGLRPRSHRTGREGPRHQTRLGRRRSLEHRASARPHHPARPCRRRPGPRHRARLHQRGHARTGAGPGHPRARAAHRSRHPSQPRRQIEAERWTELDRQLVRDADRHGVIDLAPRPDRQPDEFHAAEGRATAQARIPRSRSSARAGPMGRGRGGRDDARASSASAATSSNASTGPDGARHRARCRKLCARRRKPRRSPSSAASSIAVSTTN